VIEALLLKHEFKVIEIHVAVCHDVQCQELFAGGKM
jgi:hypothetical protein